MDPLKVGLLFIFMLSLIHAEYLVCYKDCEKQATFTDDCHFVYVDTISLNNAKKLCKNMSQYWTPLPDEIVNGNVVHRFNFTQATFKGEIIFWIKTNYTFFTNMNITNFKGFGKFKITFRDAWASKTYKVKGNESYTALRSESIEFNVKGKFEFILEFSFVNAIANYGCGKGTCVVDYNAHKLVCLNCAICYRKDGNQRCTIKEPSSCRDDGFACTNGGGTCHDHPDAECTYYCSCPGVPSNCTTRDDCDGTTDCPVSRDLSHTTIPTELTTSEDLSCPTFQTTPVTSIMSTYTTTDLLTPTTESQATLEFVMISTSSDQYETTPSPSVKFSSTQSTKTEYSYSTTTMASKTFHKLFPWLIGAFVMSCLILVLFITLFIYLRKKRRNRRIIPNIQNGLKSIINNTITNVSQIPKKDTMELDPKIIRINFNLILGKGDHATIYRGTIKGKISSFEGHNNKLKGDQVAVKLLNSSDDERTNEFDRELLALFTIGYHPHIIAFYGWTLCNNNARALVTELGSINLLQHVKSLRGQTLPFKLMLSFLFQICQALEHLASLSLIHRDVACRNVLLTDSNVAKLADFGLCCRGDKSSFIYRASLQKRFPLKWLSIEALIDRIFSEKSDVWSFGILCFEVFSYGAIPYQTMSNEEVLDFLQSGHRLEQSPDVPDSIYELMLSCWRPQPSDRPCFKDIGNFLRVLLENETVEYGYLNLGCVEEK